MDWSKEARRRAVFLGDVGERRVRERRRDRWTWDGVLSEARGLAGRGGVLVAVDVGLGVPASFLEAAQPMVAAEGFLAWLGSAALDPRVFEPTRAPEAWTPARPFFVVPHGRGGLGAYQRAAAGFGVRLWRAVDARTGARPVFATAGIPGTVGSSSVDLWRWLRGLGGGRRAFGIWPFEGALAALCGARAVVLAESYPRAAYATALRAGGAAPLRRLDVRKGHACCRDTALRALGSAPWVKRYGVALEDLDLAQRSEDAFDALLMAAALLRCALEGWPVAATPAADARTEGGILCTGTLALARPAEILACGGPAHRARASSRR